MIDDSSQKIMAAQALPGTVDGLGGHLLLADVRGCFCTRCRKWCLFRETPTQYWMTSMIGLRQQISLMGLGCQIQKCSPLKVGSFPAHPTRLWSCMEQGVLHQMLVIQASNSLHIQVVCELAQSFKQHRCLVDCEAFLQVLKGGTVTILLLIPIWQVMINQFGLDEAHAQSLPDSIGPCDIDFPY